jgi:membrane protease YdiL (CAAX protease family)
MLPTSLSLPEFEPTINRDTEREAWIVLISSTLLLLVFFYWGRAGFYTRSGLIDWVADSVGGPFTEFPGVGGYLWWGLASLVMRVVVPLLIIIFVIKRSPRSYGFRLSGISRHLPIYGAMYLVMLPVLFVVSGFNSFENFYPFYSRAAEGGSAFWLYEAGYALQFVGVEAFFRGFMTFGLLRRFGWLAIPVMTVPYTMIHFTKPMPEATAAIVAGLVLGYLAVRSRSFVPGIFLHVSVAITMDLLVLWRAGALGNIL